jgi:mycothiol synthase
MARSAEKIEVCPPDALPAAISLLAASQTRAGRASLAAAVQQQLDSADADFSGMLVAVDGGGNALASTWVQLQPGNTAVAWPAPAASPHAEALLGGAAVFAERRGISLTQLIVGPGDTFDASLFERSGFKRLAELLYLCADLPGGGRSGEDPVSLGQSVEFVVAGEDQEDRLARLIERTYEQTLDCPGLERVRSMDDVLWGYRWQGERLPNEWYFVCRDHQDVGVLLLASHPAAGSWEVIYMGLIPEVRGSGVGDAIARHALERASAAGVERVVLAVDAGNAPARSLYARHGFRAWDRRTIYAYTRGDLRDCRGSSG